MSSSSSSKKSKNMYIYNKKKYGSWTYSDGPIYVLNWGEKAKLKIGSFCSIAANLKVFLGGNHRTDWITTYPFGHIHQKDFYTFNGKGHPVSKGDVTICNDVWCYNW